MVGKQTILDQNRVMAAIVILVRERQLFKERDIEKRVPLPKTIEGAIGNENPISIDIVHAVREEMIAIIRDPRRGATSGFNDAVLRRMINIANALRQKKPPTAPPKTNPPVKKARERMTGKAFEATVATRIREWENGHISPREATEFMANLRHASDGVPTLRPKKQMREWGAIKRILLRDENLRKKVAEMLTAHSVNARERSRIGAEGQTPGLGHTGKNADKTVQRGGRRPKRRPSI